MEEKINLQYCIVLIGKKKKKKLHISGSTQCKPVIQGSTLFVSTHSDLMGHFFL